MRTESDWYFNGLKRLGSPWQKHGLPLTQAFWMSFQVTALSLYGGMVFPLAIGAVVLGVPTTSQTPLSGHFSPVLAVAPTSAIVISLQYFGI